MQKSSFQLFITRVLPFIVAFVGGATLLWDTFSKYNHVLNRGTSLTISIILFLLPFALDFYLSKKPIGWVFKDKTKGKLKSLSPYSYLLAWPFTAIFYIYFLTYNKYKGLSKEEEDATITFIQKWKERPLCLSGFFLPGNSFIDSNWKLTRTTDKYYQGQTFPEDPYTFVDCFFIHPRNRFFFYSNVRSERAIVLGFDTLQEEKGKQFLVHTQRADTTRELGAISVDMNAYDIYFTDGVIKEITGLVYSPDVHLPEAFRKWSNHFEAIGDRYSFNRVAEKNRNFIIVSCIKDTFNRGDPAVLIDHMPLTSLKELQNFPAFSDAMIFLYEESAAFLKARGISLDLNKFMFQKYILENNPPD